MFNEWKFLFRDTKLLNLVYILWFFFYFKWRFWWGIREVMVNWTNYHVHFIQCQVFTEILGIVDEFVQYVQNYFRYVCIPISPKIDDKNISWNSWKETKRSKELLYFDRYFLYGWVHFSLCWIVFQLDVEHLFNIYILLHLQ